MDEPECPGVWGWPGRCRAKRQLRCRARATDAPGCVEGGRRERRGVVRASGLKRASAMAARAAAGRGAVGARVAVWVGTRPGCRQSGVRCWSVRRDGGGGARAGLMLESGGAGVRGCGGSGAAVGGVRVGVRRGGKVGGAWNLGGTRSVPKVAPALFLIVASWGGQIQ